MNLTYDSKMFRETFESEFTWLNGFMRNVRRFSDKPAAIDPQSGRTWSYKELKADANRFANAMKKDGVKKNDIYKMFIGEILAITTMASLPGFALMAYILHRISAISYFSKMFLINPTVLGLSLVLIYGFNLVFGLLPVFRTIRKTPAAILSRTDVN